ncbi:MAG: helix-turn-helix domain-containing protein [Syntrophaceae bacterium]|nr:helix-turn-helix domain-containing protein [Syntrophaceae bacterium]
MEKICIVKRRREYTQPEVKVTVTQPAISETITPEVVVSSVEIEKNIVLPDKKIPVITEVAPPEVVASSVEIEKDTKLPDKKISEDFIDNSSSVISITMTKEQSTLLQQSEYIKDLLSGKKSDPALDIKITSDGRLSLNYHFNESLIIRMIAPNQVCQMLQVSRSFLQKLIRENKVKSYKLGRMRRFLLEDILEYLSNDTEFAQLNK